MSNSHVTVLRTILISMAISISCLIGCKKEEKPKPEDMYKFTTTVFMTTNGSGVSHHAFDYAGDYTVEWAGDTPEWTALPIVVTGDLENKVISNATYKPYAYKIGTDSEVDAYYKVINGGYQEKFEDVFVEIYDKLNDEAEEGPIDATPIEEFLKLVGNDDVYGDLRDNFTDALVIVKEYNEGNYDKENLNARAQAAYNKVYAWLFSMNTDKLPN